MPAPAPPPPAPPLAALSPAAGYGLALLGAGLATGLAALAQRWLGLQDLSLLFMLAVLAVAARTRTGPAVLTAVLCFLAYNYFFIEPRYTLFIGARQGVVTVLLFLAAALLAGRLAARLVMQVQALQAAHRDALVRQDLGQRLGAAADTDAVVAAAVAVLAPHLGAQVWVRLDDAAPSAEGASRAAAAVQHGWWFVPLRVADETLGTIGLKLPAHAEDPDIPRRAFVDAVAADIAQALLRIRLVADLHAARVTAEGERLRSALLSSVSHDLRSPLAAILGAAGSLESYGARLAEADRRSLLETIRGEGERLDRYIQNLLDMTRLGHGDLHLQRDWIGVDEVIGAAIARLRRYQPQARLVAHVAPHTAPLWVHAALLEQALFNVLENAVRYSPPEVAVQVRAAWQGDELCIEVIDRGPGIPADERERIFDMFYSVQRGDRGGGTGLGLAICRGMVGAHGGRVEALPGEDGCGTRVRLRLPRTLPPREGAA